MAVALVVTALFRLNMGMHWPTDVVGGIMISGTFVLAVFWALHHTRWHRHCHSCLWAPASAH